MPMETTESSLIGRYREVCSGNFCLDRGPVMAQTCNIKYVCPECKRVVDDQVGQAHRTVDGRGHTRVCPGRPGVVLTPLYLDEPFTECVNHHPNYYAAMR